MKGRKTAVWLATLSIVALLWASPSSTWVHADPVTKTFRHAETNSAPRMHPPIWKAGTPPFPAFSVITPYDHGPAHEHYFGKEPYFMLPVDARPGLGAIGYAAPMWQAAPFKNGAWMWKREMMGNMGYPFAEPEPEPEPQEDEPEPIVYTVQAGDTLYRLAQLYNTTVDILMMENQITDPRRLQIGQQLIIPQAKQDLEEWLTDDLRIAKTFHATLTAYTAGYESTGKTPSHPAYGITASGAKVQANHTIAVDPNVIPLGSLVYIEGLGLRKAEDTGSAIKGHKIDVYIPDLQEALEFGVKKNVKVYVLDSKKPEVQIASANKSRY